MPEVSHLLKCENTTDCHWDERAWHHAVADKTDEGTEKDPLRNIANLRLPSGFTAVDDRRYILRPEAIESVFLMYRITGEQSWQAAAWDMWTAIQRSTDTDIGNSALIDISADSPPRDDSMEVSSCCVHTMVEIKACTNFTTEFLDGGDIEVLLPDV
jgi:mannosyl-oligosaccharide alpha-1,2-mannosidase